MKFLENLSGVTELRSETFDKFEIVKEQLKKLEKLEEQIRKIGYVNDELGVLEKMINDAKEEETN